jgi:hypothetical protein
MVKRHVAAKLGTMVCTVYLSDLLGGGVAWPYNDCTELCAFVKV